MTTQQIKKDTKGFTIIEVLIVLAIAGLIMLIVFLAIPALQRTQRNNARNTEAGRVSALITDCLANRNGKLDSCDTTAEIGADFTNDFRELASFGTGAASNTNVHIDKARICTTDGSGVAPTGSGETTRDFAITYVLEPSITRCIDSQ